MKKPQSGLQNNNILLYLYLAPVLQKGLLKSMLVIILAIFMSVSCKNELSDIAAVNITYDSLPDISAKDVEFIYSDSAKVQVILTGQLMNKFEGKDPYMEFPDGFKVVFFDELMNEKTIITANYGISYDERKLMEARSDVVVINNETHETLNTEELIWDQRKKIIFSNKFVKITSDDGVLYGDGLESDETFTRRRVINPSGEINVKEDDE